MHIYIHEDLDVQDVLSIIHPKAEGGGLCKKLLK